jgi:hypothetical protein
MEESGHRDDKENLRPAPALKPSAPRKPRTSLPVLNSRPPSRLNNPKGRNAFTSIAGHGGVDVEIEMEKVKIMDEAVQKTCELLESIDPVQQLTAWRSTSNH